MAIQMENIEIARIFDEVADLLDITGASFFRVRAYRNASRVIRDLSTPLYRMLEDPDVKLYELPGIGKDLAGKLSEIVETGDLTLRRELEAQLPTGLLEVQKVPGLGPRKAHELFLELGVEDLASLGEAARAGKIRELKGFGEKTERKILEGIFSVEGYGKRMLRAEAEVFADAIVAHMHGLRGLGRIEVAGSYRRLLETVGDLDVLATAADPAAAMDRFVSYPDVSTVIAKGPTKSSVVLKVGLQVDLRVVADESWGAALQYFTGSKAHSIALRGMAIKRGLKLNEYGVFSEAERVAGRTEEEVYAALGLPWIPPELRENRGEIGLAAEGRLPVLVSLADIKGDLHMHTTVTDGRDDLAAMLAAARDRKYRYVAVTEHSRRVTMVHGLDEQALLAQWRELERVAAAFPGLHVMKGVEVDILEDGSLDLDDRVLEQADYVVASVHYNTEMPRARMTRRIVRAIENPHVDALGHPTGRKLNKRPAYQVDVDDMIAAAARTGTWLELNSAPDRLDLDDMSCNEARKHGVKISVATDAHHAGGLAFMRYGVNQARRGGLEKGDVVNTMPYRSLAARLKKKSAVGSR